MEKERHLPSFRTYKTRLNVTSNEMLEVLKRHAGIYRAAYNYCSEYQQRFMWSRVKIARTEQDYYVHPEDLIQCVKKTFRKQFPFLTKVDRSLPLAAARASRSSYERWFSNYGSFKGSHYRQPRFLSRKKDKVSFRMDTDRIQICAKHLNVPGIGKIKLFEKNYIPVGMEPIGATFSFDGKYWYFSCGTWVEDPVRGANAGNAEIMVDIMPDGNITLCGTENLYTEEAIEKIKKFDKKSKKFKSKYNRQARCNSVRSSRGTKTRTSRNMVKTRKKSKVLVVKASNWKKDYFKQKANLIVARLKPSRVHLVHEKSLGKVRQGGLTEKMRLLRTLEFFNIIRRKALRSGIPLSRHPNIEIVYA